jgi:hypothetical protein
MHPNIVLLAAATYSLASKASATYREHSDSKGGGGMTEMGGGFM